MQSAFIGEIVFLLCLLDKTKTRLLDVHTDEKLESIERKLNLLQMSVGREIHREKMKNLRETVQTICGCGKLKTCMLTN